MDRPNSQPVRLLWTGGWDSTFRLLQLLLLRGRAVQPYYVIDSDRASTGAELRTMTHLKQHLFAERPETRKLLLPTHFKELFEIRPNPTITAAFKRLHQRCFLGTQFDWLARFCEEAGLYDMEMCLEQDRDARGPLDQLLAPMVVLVGAGEDAHYEISGSQAGSDAHTLFRYFRFPILRWCKLDMQALVRKEGFEEFMRMTWFCHSPRANFRPCGVCTPCIHTAREGLGARLPFTSRLRYHLRVRARVRNWLRKHPALYTRAKQLRSRWANPVG